MLLSDLACVVLPTWLSFFLPCLVTVVKENPDGISKILDEAGKCSSVKMLGICRAQDPSKLNPVHGSPESLYIVPAVHRKPCES